MDPFERWDDWEFEKAAREIGRGYRDDQEYIRSNWKDHRTYFDKRPSGGLLAGWNGSQKRVLLSAFLFLTIVFSASGEDFVSKGVYTVYQGGMNSGNIYAALNTMAKEAIGLQNTESLPVNSVKEEIFYPPVAGAVKVAFESKNDDGTISSGIEIESTLGTAVLSPQEGVVLEVSENEKFGKVIRINFGNGWEGLLGNFGDINVEQGEPVSMGKKLGTVGISSAREKPWLYLELQKDGQPVDPLTYLIQN